MPHIYLHIPFCRRRCSYCDFAIAVRRQIPSDEFVDAVLREIDVRAPREGWAPDQLHTLYLGGGTPSLLAPEALRRLLGAFSLAPDAEVTIEANPDDVTAETVASWRDAGVTRVSLGVQSFQDHVLAWMHRTHDGKTVHGALDTLRARGYDNVSVDVIFGLPADLGHDFDADLEAALGWEPEHLSVYGLSVEPRTPLARWISRGRTTPVHDATFAEQFLTAHTTLTARGYEHYEVSNYARASAFRSRHNTAYWTGAAYIGLGPSAHGFDGRRRRWNVAQWSDYRERLNRGRDPVASAEDLTPAQRALETLYLGLRTREGVSGEVTARLRADRLDEAAAKGLIECQDGRWRATPRGWLVLDELALGLTTSAEGG